MTAPDWMSKGKKVKLKADWFYWKKGRIMYLIEDPAASGVIAIGPKPDSSDVTFIPHWFVEPHDE